MAKKIRARIYMEPEEWEVLGKPGRLVSGDGDHSISRVITIDSKDSKKGTILLCKNRVKVKYQVQTHSTYFPLDRSIIAEKLQDLKKAGMPKQLHCYRTDIGSIAQFYLRMRLPTLKLEVEEAYAEAAGKWAKINPQGLAEGAYYIAESSASVAVDAVREGDIAKAYTHAEYAHEEELKVGSTLNIWKSLVDTINGVT